MHLLPLSLVILMLYKNNLIFRTCKVSKHTAHGSNWGIQPPKSREEMNALVALPGVKSVVIPGSLGLHEEYPAVVLEAVQDFLFSSEN